MTNSYSLALTALIGTELLMVLLWLSSIRVGKADIVDLGWSLSIGLISVFFAIFSAGDPYRRLVFGALPFLWSFRLTSHIYFDRVIKSDEDGRYVALRASWGDRAQSKFLLFFLLQGGLAFLLALPFLVATSSATPPSQSQLWTAILIWSASIVGETLADRQLATFRSNPLNKGHVCREGLWYFSRHPNYFFEWLIWLSYSVAAFGVDYWYITLLQPAIMLFLILKVTGIPPTEARALESRGEEYRKYQRSTNAFFPWFPRRELP